jgi:hypothetical protein
VFIGSSKLRRKLDGLTVMVGLVTDIAANLLGIREKFFKKNVPGFSENLA